MVLQSFLSLMALSSFLPLLRPPIPTVLPFIHPSSSGWWLTAFYFLLPPGRLVGLCFPSTPASCASNFDCLFSILCLSFLFVDIYLKTSSFLPRSPIFCLVSFCRTMWLLPLCFSSYVNLLKKERHASSSLAAVLTFIC